MHINKEINRKIIGLAHSTRNKACPNDGAAVDVFKICKSLEISTTIAPLDSIEGFYKKDIKLVIVSNQRPLYKQRYTCAHELGHFLLKHDTELIIQNGSSNHAEAEEYAAELFAAHLLMPRVAVATILSQHQVDLTNPKASDLLKIANRLQVGFQALLTHLRINFNYIKPEHYNKLKKFQRKNILIKMYPNLFFTHNIIQIEDEWEKQFLEIQIEDLLLLSVNEQLTTSMKYSEEQYGQYRAVRFHTQGKAKIINSTTDRELNLGVRDINFSGRSLFRNLEP